MSAKHAILSRQMKEYWNDKNVFNFNSINVAEKKTYMQRHMQTDNLNHPFIFYILFVKYQRLIFIAPTSRPYDSDDTEKVLRSWQKSIQVLYGKTGDKKHPINEVWIQKTEKSFYP